jgi:ankyrin repeat protein
MMTGSFNPIDEGEWSEQAYIHPTALLFQAIAKHDRATIQRLLKDEEAGVNLHRRDHVGRTALHVAILVKAEEIAEDLIDAGARITARLAFFFFFFFFIRVYIALEVTTYLCYAKYKAR